MLIDVVLPLASALVTYTVLATYRYMTEGSEKRYLRSAFEHYLNPNVVASVVDDPQGLRLSGERRHLAILFSDIVNFTSRAERSEPERVVALLNTYMSVMIDIIFQSQGVVDKLMGDGIMAFWGAPNAIENPAREAIDCALNMMEGLEALRKADERFADVDIGIGIATGEAVVGNFGGEQRFDYSVIGDTVNLASRLEGLTRPFKVGILANRPTLEEAGGGFITREIGLVKVKGKEQLVPIVDVAGRAGNGIDPTFYQRFNRALEHIRNGEATAANTMLRTLRQRSARRRAGQSLSRENRRGDRRPADRDGLRVRNQVAPRRIAANSEHDEIPRDDEREWMRGIDKVGFVGAHRAVLRRGRRFAHRGRRVEPDLGHAVEWRLMAVAVSGQPHVALHVAPDHRDLRP